MTQRHQKNSASVTRRKRGIAGFTLIELLIVVAIIAILAAIAVPNFLEAQTRSKISRAKADMRTISVAVESYRVDHNTYMDANPEDESPLMIPPKPYGGYGELTSPIAYLSTIPQDGFGNTNSTQNNFRPPTYGMGSGKASPRVAIRAGGNPADTYEIDSDGPDKWDQTNGDYANGQYPWPKITNVSDLNQQISYGGETIKLAGIPYDPTNGTVSTGEILRFGGLKPAGAVYDYLWTAAGQ